MNLHRIVSTVISAVNPNQMITVQTSAGYITNPDGTLVPQYSPAFDRLAQVQELTSRDLRQLDALNIQGSMRTVYLNGEVDGIIRISKKGGDLITLQRDGSIWLTTAVLEQWDTGWCKLAITLQTDAIPVPDNDD